VTRIFLDAVPAPELPCPAVLVNACVPHPAGGRHVYAGEWFYMFGGQHPDIPQIAVERVRRQIAQAIAARAA
jgi:hypothetical protein